MAGRAAPMLGLSIVAHAALIGGLLVASRGRAPSEAPPEARSIAPMVEARFDAARRVHDVRSRRVALVEAARRALAERRLSLGEVLLEAGRLDAEEAGIELDVESARALYAERLAAFRAVLARDPEGGVVKAVPAVFVDLRYHGRPGGLMASALLDGGGSCEQVSQLVAAIVHDAGRADEVGLRHYGGVMEDGASHVTPVALTKNGEHDLMTGQPVLPGGVRVPAQELIEIYARAHGLAPAPSGVASPSAPTSSAASSRAAASRPPSDAAAGTSTARQDPARPTIAAGFPPNADRFPGALPLYAARAVRDPSSAPPSPNDAESLDLEARHCAYSLRIAMLDPPSIEIFTGGPGGALSVEPRRVAPPLRLEREAALLRAAETVASRPGTDPVDRLMGWACIAVLGETAAIDFAFARETALARAAVHASERGRAQGALALAAIDWTGDEGARAAAKLNLDYGGRSWVLLALPGGDRVVKGLVARGGRETWGRISALGALVVWPDTRGWALAFVSTLPLTDQVDVMHEVFHAHDHMRPWGSNFDLGGTVASTRGPAELLTAYRVFRGLASRLWEGQRPPGETLDALSTEVRAAGLDDAWHAALLRYYANNALGLYSQRPNGKEIVPLLRRAALALPHPSLDPLRAALAYLDAEPELDARTVADAMRHRD